MLQTGAVVPLLRDEVPIDVKLTVSNDQPLNVSVSM